MVDNNRRNKRVLKNEINRLNNDISKLENDIKFLNYNHQFDRVNEVDNSNDDDDDDESLDELMERLLNSGESDALNSLLDGVDDDELNNSSDKYDTNKKKRTIDPEKSLSKYKGLIELNSNFTGVELSTPNLIIQNDNLRLYSIKGSLNISKVRKINWSAEILHNTTNHQVQNLKLFCDHFELVKFLSKLEESKSLPTFMLNLRAICEFCDDRRRLLKSLQKSYPNLFQSTKPSVGSSIRLINENGLELTLIYSFKWNSLTSNIEPHFRLLPKVPINYKLNKQGKNALNSIIMNFDRMIARGWGPERSTMVSILAFFGIEPTRKYVNYNEVDQIVNDKVGENNNKKVRRRRSTSEVRNKVDDIVNQNQNQNVQDNQDNVHSSSVDEFDNLLRPSPERHSKKRRKGLTSAANDQRQQNIQNEDDYVSPTGARVSRAFFDEFDNLTRTRS